LYALQPDIKSHTEIIMTMEKVSTNTAYYKQKLNTKSSIEAELKTSEHTMAQVLRPDTF